MFVVFSLFFFFSQIVSAAEPTPGSCNYYLEKEKETGCFVKGNESSDYLLNFGYRLCHIYLEKAKSWNDERAEFIRKAALCLQEELERTPHNGNCKELEEKAYATHPPCYVKSGYCELSVAKKSSIIWTAVAADALMKNGNKSVFYGFQLLKDCKGSSTTATVE